MFLNTPSELLAEIQRGIPDSERDDSIDTALYNNHRQEALQSLGVLLAAELVGKASFIVPGSHYRVEVSLEADSLRVVRLADITKGTPGVNFAIKLDLEDEEPEEGYDNLFLPTDTMEQEEINTLIAVVAAAALLIWWLSFSPF